MRMTCKKLLFLIATQDGCCFGLALPGGALILKTAFLGHAIVFFEFN